MTNTANLDSVRWNFGDGASATDLEPVHLYQAPGAYKVSMTGYFNGSAFSDSLTVTVHPKPAVELGDTVLLFTGSTIDLHAGGGYMEYLWSTQSTDSVITASTQGQYWTRVKDYNCCINSDSVYVRIFDYYTPNAFTPNGDGLNDLFRVVGKYRNIDFAMYIYDRWGGMVFESDDIDAGWDGNIGGQPAPAGVYVWTFRIKFRGEDIKTGGDVVFKGTVTLVR
jgi:gliding motility-associated-like protein